LDLHHLYNTQIYLASGVGVASTVRGLDIFGIYDLEKEN